MTEKRAKSFLIVGAYFRPPAKALVACLPAGASVWLQPEPTNPYDEHAVKVLVNLNSYPEAIHEELELQSAGYGFDLAGLLDGDPQTNEEMTQTDIPHVKGSGWWHIGYIPAQKAGKGGEPADPEAIQWNMDRIIAASPNGVPATIAFDAAGKPLVMVSPWPPQALPQEES